MNPFYTTYEYIPFDKIQETDYEPAMMKGIEDEDQEIDKIGKRLAEINDLLDEKEMRWLELDEI